MFYAILSLYAADTSCKNFLQNTSKPHLGQLCPLSHQKPQNKTFPGKNNLGELIRLSFAVIHAKKTETLHALIFHVTWKN